MNNTNRNDSFVRYPLDKFMYSYIGSYLESIVDFRIRFSIMWESSHRKELIKYNACVSKIKRMYLAELHIFSHDDQSDLFNELTKLTKSDASRFTIYTMNDKTRFTLSEIEPMQMIRLYQGYLYIFNAKVSA